MCARCVKPHAPHVHKLTYICNRHWDKILVFNQTQAKSNDKTNWNYEMNCLLLLPLLPDPNYLVLVLYSRLSSPFWQSPRTRNTLAAEKAPFIRALAKQVVSLLYVFGHFEFPSEAVYGTPRQFSLFINHQKSPQRTSLAARWSWKNCGRSWKANFSNIRYGVFYSEDLLTNYLQVLCMQIRQRFLRYSNCRMLIYVVLLSAVSSKKNNFNAW